MPKPGTWLKQQFAERWQMSPSNYAKTIEWAKLTGITGATQIFIQALGLISGILVIRLLSTENYALYTLANTMLGTMVVLADSGIAAGVMAQSSKVWKSKEELGSVLNTGMDLRKKFAIGSLLIAAPILVYLLHYHGANYWLAALILLSLIPAFFSSLTGTIFQIPLKLHQSIKPLQRNVIVENVARFVLILSLYILPFTAIAILASGIPRLYTNIRLKLLSRPFVDWRQSLNTAVRGKILKIVKRLMPGAIYYCISGQVSVWLISIFGSTENVAQIGALGRIALILTVVSSVFGTLVFPRFARLETSTAVLLRRFLQIILLLILICAAITGAVFLFSSEILLILGPNYSDLDFELVLSIIASCAGLIGGSVFTLSTQRGWAVHPGLSIPVSVGAIVVGAIVLPVSTLQGILVFNIFVASVQVLLNSGYFLYEIFTHSSPQQA